MNQAALAEYDIATPEAINGKYNIFRDSSSDVGRWVKAAARRVYQGETVVFKDIRVPPEKIKKCYDVHDRDLETLCRDITVFPVPDEVGQMVYFAVFVIYKPVYRFREELIRAKKYLEAHWMEKYDGTRVADVAGLKQVRFIRLFTKHFGLTPYKYYTQYRIDKVKNLVRNTDLSIEEAFAACNMDYNGHFAKVFRNIVGLSPYAYRKHFCIKNSSLAAGE
ncbi:MAG: AraC family transcriptional regulator [Synergistaceae bacterium]|nr:AraC family transcriptional regulator [Synergistaceae bacterium]